MMTKDNQSSVGKVGLVAFLAILWCSVGMASEVPVGDKEIVLQTLAMESASHPEGMLYVALTLYNRARDRHTTMSEEAQRPYQYSCWNSAKWAVAWLYAYYNPKTAWQASNSLKQGIKMGLEGKYPTLKHYCTTDSRPWWAKGKRPAFILGGHKWYEGIR